MNYIIKKTIFYKIFISIPISFILSFLYWKHIRFSIIFTILSELISSITYLLFEKIYNRYNNIEYLENIEKENIKFYLNEDYDTF